MEKTIIGKIEDTLDKITQIKEYYAYPLQSNPTKYPAVVFFKTGMQENSFDNNKENFKIFTFNLSLIISASGTTIKEIYEDILPDISDLLVQTFDEDWNFSTIDGHRCWARLSSGNRTISQEQNATTIQEDYVLQIKLNTNT